MLGEQAARMRPQLEPLPGLVDDVAEIKPTRRTDRTEIGGFSVVSGVAPANDSC
jgi:hypothetical protein